MPHSDQSPNTEDFSAVFDQLLKAGWVTEFGFHGERFAAKWTPKGKQQMLALRAICIDAHVKPSQMAALVLIGMLTKEIED